MPSTASSDAAFVPTLTGFAPVRGTALYYEVTGRGEPVVLLHGFSFDRRLWDDQVAPLAARHTVVRYDLRGFGKSAPSTEPYTHADDLRALLDHLGFARAALIGLSMGGGAAVNFAVAYPERVRALVLVDSTLAGYKWSRDFADAQTAVNQIARAGDLEGARTAWLALSMFAPTMANAQAAARLRMMVDDYSGWHWSNPDPGMPMKPRAIERLGEIRAPTLVVVGERDTADFHGIAATLAKGIPNATAVVLAGAGHVANLESPAEFNTVVTKYLDSDAS